VKHPIIPLESNWIKIKNFIGPEEDRKIQFFADCLAGKSASLYPMFNGQREGDPICDR
jgi:hypothetical protein